MDGNLDFGKEQYDFNPDHWQYFVHFNKVEMGHLPFAKQEVGSDVNDFRRLAVYDFDYDNITLFLEVRLYLLLQHLSDASTHNIHRR